MRITDGSAWWPASVRTVAQASTFGRWNAELGGARNSPQTTNQHCSMCRGETATRRSAQTETGADRTKSLLADHLSDLSRVERGVPDPVKGNTTSSLGSVLGSCRHCTLMERVIENVYTARGSASPGLLLGVSLWLFWWCERGDRSHARRALDPFATVPLLWPHPWSERHRRLRFQGESWPRAALCLGASSSLVCDMLVLVVRHILDDARCGSLL